MDAGRGRVAIVLPAPAAAPRRRRAGRWFRLDRIDRAVLTTERVAPRDLVEVFGTPPADAAPLLAP